MLASGVYGYASDYLLWLLLFVSLVVHSWCFFRFFPRKRRPKSGLVLGNLLIFATLAGAAGLIGETYYRYLAIFTESFGVTLPARRWFALYVDLNELGVRDVSWSPQKPPGVRRIAFVGDSFTYGWGIEQVEDRFTERLERRLTASGRSVEVLNVAKPGWSTGQQGEPVRDVIDWYGVEEIVLVHVLNDIEDLLPTSPTFNPLNPPQMAWLDPDRSALAEQLFYRLYVPRMAEVSRYSEWLATGYAEPAIREAHLGRLAAMAGYCREKGVAFKVVLLPFVRSGSELNQAAVHAAIRDHLEHFGVPVVDALPALEGLDRGDLVVNRFDAHPNEAAHAIFAESIWQGLYAAEPTALSRWRDDGPGSSGVDPDQRD